MTHEEAVEKYGSAQKIADLLGISKQAVCNWKQKEHIPRLREYQLKEKENEK